MRTRMRKFLVFIILTQLGLTACDAVELSLEEFLNYLQLAQTEVTSGELKFIKKHDALPTKSKEKANAEAEAAILELEERFSELPAEVREQSRYRRMHERNIQLSRKYLPEMISGEQSVHEEWNLAFEVAYFSRKSKEPIFAHRFTRKDIKKYVDPGAAEFYNAGLTNTVIFDGQRAILSTEAPPNVINPPEAPLGASEDFVYEIRLLIGKCIDTNLQRQDIEIFAPVTGGKSEYVFAIRIGKEKHILKKVFIDIKKGFGVKRIEYFSPPDAEYPYKTVEFLEYQSSSGIWHPRKIRRVGYQIKGDTRRISRTEEWNIKSAKFNVRFPDDYFRIPEKLGQFIQ
ncbi:MAG: hypothetical protein OXP71_16080 [Candidatus Poribacteria bacterium]|nr:hypothetical protein [Candidatus Poribacteria bacterium]